LTQLEYYEFGNPRESVVDMSELIKISPVDTLPTEGADIFVIARTGENDSQVFAYEPVKWILRLRGSEGKNKIPKLLGFLKNEGHFFSGKLASKTRGEDLALLNSWVRHKISTQDIEMARRDRKTRQRKTRKAMEGGKRRRRATRRGRKTARKH
jgi:protease II